MRRPVTKLGKVGNMVWGRNHHGQTYYSLVVSINPRTGPQQVNRHSFGGTGPGWGRLKDEERAQWNADARNYRTHGRPGGSAPMRGFELYMSVNAKRAQEGLSPLRLPPPTDKGRARSPSAPLRPSIPPPASSSPPLPLPRASHAPAPPPAHRCATPRAPMQYRSATVAIPWIHRCNALALLPAPFPAPVYPRAGPGPPRLLSSSPTPNATWPLRQTRARLVLPGGLHI